MDFDDIRKLKPEWKNGSVKVTQLSGGLVNKSYYVETGSRAFTVRVPGRNRGITIDREVEKRNMELLSRIEVVPKLIDFIEDGRIMVREFVPGTTVKKEMFNDPETRWKAVDAIRRIHGSGIRLYNSFDVFSEIRRNQDLLRGCTSELLNEYPINRICEITRKIEKKVSKKPSVSVACHNDLLPENFILTDDTIRIIDWEYAGMNDPCYDLANHLTELDNLDESEESDVIDLYFGKRDAPERERVQLYKLPSRFSWALWATIQMEASELNFNFEGYSRHQFDQCLALMNMLATEYSRL